MTRKEAIEVVKAYRDKLTYSASNQLDGDIEALDMAIEALNQKKKERGLYDAVNSILNKLMDDTWNNRYPHYELIQGYCLEVLKLIELDMKGGE